MSGPVDATRKQLIEAGKHVLGGVTNDMKVAICKTFDGNQYYIGDIHNDPDVFRSMVEEFWRRYMTEDKQIEAENADTLNEVIIGEMKETDYWKIPATNESAELLRDLEIPR